MAEASADSVPSDASPARGSVDVAVSSTTSKVSVPSDLSLEVDPEVDDEALEAVELLPLEMVLPLEVAGRVLEGLIVEPEVLGTPEFTGPEAVVNEELAEAPASKPL